MSPEAVERAAALDVELRAAGDPARAEQSRRAKRTSGVTLREAVKPLSEAQRLEVLAAR